MKKQILLIFTLASLAACKSIFGGKTPVVQTLTGEFLYADNAGILRTDPDIYGVVANEKLNELNQRSESLKTDKYDMVLVTVKGILRKNPHRGGWKQVVEIQELLSVEKSTEKESDFIIKKR